MKTGKVLVFLMGVALLSACAIKATPYLWKSYEGPAIPKRHTVSGNVALHNEFVAIDEAGALYNGFSIYNEQSFNPRQFLRKLSDHGTELWRVALQGRGPLRETLTDDGILVGNHQYLASTPGYDQVHITRLSGDGFVQWESLVGAADSTLGDIVYSDMGTTYVTYLENAATYTEFNIMVTAIDAQGETLWTTKVETLTGPITPPDIALLADNRLLVTFDTRTYPSPAFAVTLSGEGDVMSRENIGNIGWKYGTLPLYSLSDQVLMIGEYALLAFNEDGSVRWSQTVAYGSTCSAPKPDGIACFYPYPNQNGLYDLTWYGLDGSTLHTAAVPWQPMQVVSSGSGKWVFLERFIPDDNTDKTTLSQFFDRFHVLSNAGVELSRLVANPGFGMSTGLSEEEYQWISWEAADMVEHFDAQADRLIVAGRRGGPADDSVRDNRIYTGEFSLK